MLPSSTICQPRYRRSLAAQGIMSGTSERVAILVCRISEVRNLIRLNRLVRPVFLICPVPLICLILLIRLGSLVCITFLNCLVCIVSSFTSFFSFTWPSFSNSASSTSSPVPPLSGGSDHSFSSYKSPWPIAFLIERPTLVIPKSCCVANVGHHAYWRAQTIRIWAKNEWHQ